MNAKGGNVADRSMAQANRVPWPGHVTAAALPQSVLLLLLLFTLSLLFLLLLLLCFFLSSLFIIFFFRFKLFSGLGLVGIGKRTIDRLLSAKWPFLTVLSKSRFQISESSFQS